MSGCGCNSGEKGSSGCSSKQSGSCGGQKPEAEKTSGAECQANAVRARRVDGLEGVHAAIAVASGKGGVGKSTVAVNLAYGLAAMGAKVGILDADIYGPSIVRMTGIAADEVTQDEITGMIVPPQKNGVKVISAAMFVDPKQASILRGPMVSRMVQQFLTSVQWGELDYLIIDYPPGTGDIQLTLSQTAPLHGALIVTTPQEVAMADARKAIGMFTTLNVPILGVAETMSYFICDGCDKKHAIFREGGGLRLAQEYQTELLCQIPIGPEVVLASDNGEPIVDRAGSISAAKEALLLLCQKVHQKVGETRTQSQLNAPTFGLSWQ